MLEVLIFLRAFLLLPLLGLWSQQPQFTEDASTAEELVATLGEKIIEDGKSRSFVVGWIADGERHWQGFGSAMADDEALPDQRTLYEIGSISKVFTGLLLADAVERGVATPDDPIALHVPQGVEVCADETAVLLRHLVTHTSGFPRLPDNWAPVDLLRPYADYNRDDLYNYVGDYVLNSEPGEAYAYSNLGMGLLGQLMVNANEALSYHSLLQERVSTPLGLSDTTARLDDVARSMMAAPYGGSGHAKTQFWEFGALVGCGGIRSNVRDMLAFAAVQLDPGDSSLAPAIARSHEQLFTDEKAGFGVAYGWHQKASDEGYGWHDGQTGGYQGYLEVDREKKVAVVLLSASVTSREITGLAEKLRQFLVK